MLAKQFQAGRCKPVSCDSPADELQAPLAWWVAISPPAAGADQLVGIFSAALLFILFGFFLDSPGATRRLCVSDHPLVVRRLLFLPVYAKQIVVIENLRTETQPDADLLRVASTVTVVTHHLSVKISFSTQRCHTISRILRKPSLELSLY